MADLRKVKPGELLTIPASAYNAFVDAALDYQGRMLNLEKTGMAAGQNGNLIVVKNNSGADRDRFQILGIDSVVISPTDNLQQFQNRPAIVGVTPNVNDHRGKFMILAEPIKSGQLGLAWIAGVCPVQVYFLSENHRYADVGGGGSSCLSSGDSGVAQILWSASTSGVSWALVRLGAGGGQGTVFPVQLEQTGGSQGTDSTPATWTYTVKDIFGNTLAIMVNPTSSPHVWKRPSVGYMIPATAGIAFYNSINLLSLAWINEVADQEACQPE
jgi:hypothetical protein